MNQIKSLGNVFKRLENIHRIKRDSLNCYHALRDNDGRKTIVSTIKGVKISDFEITGDDSVILKYSSKQGGFNSPFLISLYLSNLRMINIYECCVEFLTTNRIDFLYTIPGSTLNFELLGFLNVENIKPTLAFQWVYKDEKLDDQLDNLGKIVINEKDIELGGFDFT